MCKKCEARKELLNLLGVEVKTKVIGKVESPLILKLSLAENEVDKIKMDTESQLQILIMQGYAKEECLSELDKMYGQQFKAASEKVNKAWEEICSKFNLTAEDVENEGYKLNMRTGELFKEELVHEDLVKH